MINKSTRPPSISVRRQSLTIAVLLTLAVVLLLVQFGSLVAWDAKAIRYPFGLEYGEGMVWQQMRLILSGHAYGPIQDVPAIVFQYPPLYYLVVGGLSRATSWDELACGRLVSVAAAGFVLLFAALIVFQALRRECQARAALACAIVCALAIASFIPMQRFSALMRVDMTALAFSFAGVFLGLRALNRPRLVHFPQFALQHRFLQSKHLLPHRLLHF